MYVNDKIPLFLILIRFINRVRSSNSISSCIILKLILYYNNFVYPLDKNARSERILECVHIF